VEQFVKCRLGGGYENRQPISNLEQEKLKNLPPELKKDFKYYFINGIHYAPQDSIGFNGKIYLLIDGNVFSSAEAFATFAKSTGFATLVGENTGGDGIGIDPAICALPNSGYTFRFPQQMGLTSDGSCDFEHKTDPYIKVSANKNSNLSNDEAVQTVLKLVN
jgi:C-terminal processing protease CtpA/Prc